MQELLTKELPYHDVRLEFSVFIAIYQRRLPRQPTRAERLRMSNDRSGPFVNDARRWIQYEIHRAIFTGRLRLDVSIFV